MAPGWPSLGSLAQYAVAKLMPEAGKVSRVLGGCAILSPALLPSTRLFPPLQLANLSLPVWLARSPARSLAEIQSEPSALPQVQERAYLLAPCAPPARSCAVQCNSLPLARSFACLPGRPASVQTGSARSERSH